MRRRHPHILGPQIPNTHIQINPRRCPLQSRRDNIPRHQPLVHTRSSRRCSRRRAGHKSEQGRSRQHPWRTHGGGEHRGGRVYRYCGNEFYWSWCCCDGGYRWKSMYLGFEHHEAARDAGAPGSFLFYFSASLP